MTFILIAKALQHTQLSSSSRVVPAFACSFKLKIQPVVHGVDLALRAYDEYGTNLHSTSQGLQKSGIPLRVVSVSHVPPADAMLGC